MHIGAIMATELGKISLSVNSEQAVSMGTRIIPPPPPKSPLTIPALNPAKEIMLKRFFNVFIINTSCGSFPQEVFGYSVISRSWSCPEEGTWFQVW